MTSTSILSGVDPFPWKTGWKRTTEHYRQWWNHTGMVVTVRRRRSTPRIPIQPRTDPAPFDGLVPALRAHDNRCILAGVDFWGDALPMGWIDIGVNCLGMLLGAKPELQGGTMWLHPNITDPQTHPRLAIDPQSDLWKAQLAIIDQTLSAAQGDFFVGIPQLLEGLDVLCALRGNENLLMDLLVQPEWVEERMAQIEETYFFAYEAIYNRIKLPDGSTAYAPFEIWGPGRTTCLQCDFSAMISTEMFDRFVVPHLMRQSAHMDNSLYHLDGTTAMHHLESILAIKDIDAIQWQPQAGLERAADPHWFPLYRRIMDAGKSVFVTGASPDQVVPLLDAIGTRGVYLMMGGIRNVGEYENLMDILSRYGYDGNPVTDSDYISSNEDT